MLLTPAVAQRLRRLHRAVVELDALADADRARAEHDGLRARQRLRLVLLLVGAVEVRRCRLELGGAGIDHLVGRQDAPLATRVADACSGIRSEACAIWRSEKPVRLARRRAAGVEVASPGSSARSSPTMRAQLVGEPASQCRAAAPRSSSRRVHAQRGEQRPEADVVGRRIESSDPLGLRRPVGSSQASGAHLQRAHRLLQRRLEVRSIAITSPVAFICVPRARSPRELVERPARNLDDEVVQRRLEGGDGLACVTAFRSRPAACRRRSWPRPGRSDSRSPSRRARRSG